MAERKKNRPKRKEKNKNQGPEPSKLEKALATHVRFNCPTKTTMCSGEEVHYFTASKAVDCLMKSKWYTGKSKTEILFTNRNGCVHYMQTLLDKGLIWRARKLVPRRKERETKEGKGKKETEEKDKESSSKKEKEGESTPKKSPKKKKVTEESSVQENNEEKDSSDKKDDSEGKKKKKIKLEFHPEQIFKDGTDVYVWHFDPVSWTKFLIGLGLVLGSIMVCLFPLWPEWLRLGIYYVSLVAMGFVGFLVVLIVLRTILFGVIWMSSWGQHHLWVLPNLTEDCGFFESFQPWYSYKYYPSGVEDKKKDKSQDKDDESDQAGKPDEDTDTDRDTEPEEGAEGKESESSQESSQQGTPRTKTQVRRRKQKKENENGFEIVDKPQQ